MSDAALTLLTLAGVVVLFVSHRVPVEIVAVDSALVLYGPGSPSLPAHLRPRPRGRRQCHPAR